MGDGAEGRRDDRLVKVARLLLTSLPPLPLTYQAGRSREFRRGVRTHRLHRVGLAPAAGSAAELLWHCWRQAVADARICGKPPAPAGDYGQCGEACADPAHCLPKGTRFHDLRHFYASTLIAANLNPKVIQARLGHATITETMDTYGHLFPDAEDLGRGAIDAVFAVALAEQGRNQDAN